MRMQRPAFLYALFVSAFTARDLPAQAIDSAALGAHARALAHDSLRGRDTGSAGERAAARYVAAALELYGLAPVDSAGMIIPLPLLLVHLEEESRIILDDSATFAAGRDFVLSAAGYGALTPFRGPVVVVPSTLDPVPGEAVAGRVVVTGGPLGEQGREAIRRWRDGGARAVILPVLADSQYQVFAQASAPRLVVAANVDEQVWQPDLPILVAGPALSRALLGDLSPTPSDRPWFESNHILDAGLRFRTVPVQSAIVAAIVPGTEPALRDEPVVLTAHYDHLGLGPVVDGDSIYNGLSDNAAGVAMLLEIARILAQSPAPRSVLFLFTSGEERGLLGSSWWAAHGPIAADRVRAVLNLDAGVPAGLPVRWRVAGDTTRPAVQTAADVIRSKGWIADVTGANSNSDHWPFMERGVPTVFLVPGRDWEGFDAAARDSLHAHWDRYHHPGDEWRPGFPLAGLQRFASLALDITRALAR